MFNRGVLDKQWVSNSKKGSKMGKYQVKCAVALDPSKWYHIFTVGQVASFGWVQSNWILDPIQVHIKLSGKKTVITNLRLKKIMNWASAVQVWW